MQRVAPIWRRLIPLVLAAALAVWALYSFGQELYLEHQLGVQAAQLQQQNDALAAQNEGYQRDNAALESGAAAEEDARLNGYARGDEKVYLVGPAPTPTPAAPAASAASGAAHRAAARPAPSRSFWDWLTGFFHR